MGYLQYRYRYCGYLYDRVAIKMKIHCRPSAPARGPLGPAPSSQKQTEWLGRLLNARTPQATAESPSRATPWTKAPPCAWVRESSQVPLANSHTFSEQPLLDTRRPEAGSEAIDETLKSSRLFSVRSCARRRVSSRWICCSTDAAIRPSETPTMAPCGLWSREQRRPQGRSVKVWTTLPDPTSQSFT